MITISRRALLGAAGLSVAAGIGIPFASGVAGSTSTGQFLRSRAPIPAAFRRKLAIPPVLRPVRSDAGTDYYDITQTVARAAILPGLTTPLWTYNGSFPGPTIRSTRGRAVQIRHTNKLPLPTVVHLHGGRTPETSDGYPIDFVYPTDMTYYGEHHDPNRMAADPDMALMTRGHISQGRRTYTYPLDQRAATLWYHDHRMDFTGPSVWRGLAGFHLHHDDEEAALRLPAGDRDLPLMIADRSFDADGTLLYPSVDPTLVNRHGGLLAAPLRHDHLELAPAQRFDILVDFSAYAPGTRVTMVNDFDTAAMSQIMQFVVDDSRPEPAAIPDRLSTVTPLREQDAVTTRKFDFRTGDVDGHDGWLISHQPFNPDTIAARVKLGTTEIWQLNSDFHHPVHLHLSPFQVLSRGSEGPGPYDAGWKDTIDLRPSEQARILVHFDGYPGKYVLHCHNLEHEDMAMMANFITT